MTITSNLVEDGITIFLFHGVVDRNPYKVRNYTKKHLAKDYFIEILDELKSVGTPLSMNEIVGIYKSGRPLPSKGFAITFDDGFENNYSIAAPILKEKNIPATFYVTTGFIENSTSPWTDRIEYCFEETTKTEITLEWKNDVRSIQSTQEKIHVLDDIRHFVKNNREIDINAFISNMYNQCGVVESLPNDEQLDKKMAWDQIKELANDDSFIVGGHTHTHEIMSFLTDEQLDFEINTCLSLLKSHIGKVISHFSYPEGMAYCYNDKVISKLKESGIICSPSAIHGVNSKNSDLFNLNRISVV